MQLLRDNLTLWTSDQTEAGDGSRITVDDVNDAEGQNAD